MCLRLRRKLLFESFAIELLALACHILRVRVSFAGTDYCSSHIRYLLAQLRRARWDDLLAGGLAEGVGSASRSDAHLTRASARSYTCSGRLPVVRTHAVRSRNGPRCA